MRKSQSLESRAEKDSLADLARSILASRRRRAQFFGNGIFSDPSWDILLDLRAHHGSERRISSLFVADCAPVSTGLTHLRRLHERGLVDRWVDPKDGRRRLARLSDHGLALMDQFLLALRTTSAMRN
ncbi:hypothetical protein [Sphingobium sp. AP50]|uniref:hypothetical protein n=1 Tax=Sphingobium sp. AP50 TaxID=1884369 RepID=UPI00116047AE|nr:hypothetical protein [Sphingobium sp. AP50]